MASQLIPLTGIVPAVRTAPPHVLTLLDVLFGEPRQLTAFLSAAIALGLFGAAYIAEIVRAGVESIDRGQWETRLSLRRAPTMWLVIGPRPKRIWPRSQMRSSCS